MSNVCALSHTHSAIRLSLRNEGQQNL